MWRVSFYFDEFADSALFGFRGRMPRAAFFATLFWRLALGVVAFLALVTVFAITGRASSAGLSLLVCVPLAYVSIVPPVIKRFHDFGAPAWTAIALMSLPLLPFAIAYAARAEQNASAFLGLLTAFYVMPLWFLTLAVTSLIPSSPKTNKYGPNLNA